MNLKAILFGAAITAFCMSGVAQTNNGKVKTRQNVQAQKINQGVKSGELTKREAVQLRQQQKSINQTKKMAAADGVVTKKEKAMINHQQNKAAKNIARKKNNDMNRD